MNIKRSMYSLGARWMALTAASWSSIIAITAPVTSLAGRSIDGSDLGEILNILILIATFLGWADILWHDIRGKLIWPSLDSRLRHNVCVALYAGLAGMTGLRAFVAVSSEISGAHTLGMYYVATAIGIAIIAVAIALEER